jgi:hypothetical protein
VSPEKVEPVASPFVSRVDTQVDKALDAIGSPESLGLANAKAMYRRFREIFDGEQFESPRRRGARTMAPAGKCRNKKTSYSDVLYVEELIGPDTVNTLPPHFATMDAFAATPCWRIWPRRKASCVRCPSSSTGWLPSLLAYDRVRDAIGKKVLDRPRVSV